MRCFLKFMIIKHTTGCLVFLKFILTNILSTNYKQQPELMNYFNYSAIIVIFTPNSSHVTINI